MLTTLQALLANLGVIAILIVGWSYTFEWSRRLPPIAKSCAMALAAAACATILMSMPIQLRPGLIVDLRAVPTALAAFYGGATVGIAVGVVAALFRLYLGGVGAQAGAIGIAILVATGLLARLFYRRAESLKHLWIVAATISLASIAGALFLPADIRGDAIARIALPNSLFCFIATLLVSGTIASENRRFELAAENRLYRSLIDACPEPLNGKYADGRFFAANSATAELMQAGEAANLIDRTDFDFYPREVAETFRKDEEAAIALRKPTIVEQHVRRRDGSTIWLSTLKAALMDAKGSPIGLLTHNRDITELKQLRVVEERTRSQLDDALAGMADALALFDRRGGLVLCNQQYRSLFPNTDAIVDGARLDDMLAAALNTGDVLTLSDIVVDRHDDSKTSPGSERQQQDVFLKDGRILSIRHHIGSNGTFVVLMSDVTKERKTHKELIKLNGQLTEIARTDALTGLANRRVFDETLHVEVGRGNRTGSPLTLLIIDIDFFKAYNDSKGHVAGDACIRKVSRALGKSVHRPGDLIARYGGEEFAAILPDTDESGARSVADRMLKSVRELVIEHPTSVHRHVTVSIGGVTLSHEEGRWSVSNIIEAADRSLYVAKSSGRNRAMFALEESGCAPAGTPESSRAS